MRRLYIQLIFSRIVMGLLCLSLFLSCNTSKRGLFSKRTAHEKYGDALESAGLNTSAMGKLWFAAADKSLTTPLIINLPYNETGYFAAEKPGAAGYRFTAKTGEKLSIKIITRPATGILFLELWQPGIGTNQLKFLDAADTLTRQLEYEVDKETDFMIRLQPELLKGIEYTLTITTQPSLAFPVHESGKPRVISLWGVARDGGSRSHEGVDIAASFRTPVLAASDGRVIRVNENNLGGKVIFMRPEKRVYSLYYAHLDSQIAVPGQQVKQGDTLGLLGNTGNAKNTVPHLHFGIYASNGAIDPFPFINPNKIILSPITASLKELNEFVRNRSTTSVYKEPSVKGELALKLEPENVMQVLSATGSWYKVLLPDQQEGFISSNNVTGGASRELRLRQETKLLDAPDSSAAARTVIEPDENVSILGKYVDYYLVRHNQISGWIKKD